MAADPPSSSSGYSGNLPVASLNKKKILLSTYTYDMKIYFSVLHVWCIMNNFFLKKKKEEKIVLKRFFN